MQRPARQEDRERADDARLHGRRGPEPDSGADVAHPDDGVDGTDYALRLPYVVDTVNAVKAVKAPGYDFLDTDHVGWFGRSMGGGVTLRALAVQPGLVDAAAVWASVSSLQADNWERWYADNPGRRGTNRRIEKSYGLPDDAPAFWRRASARPYFDDHLR